MTILTSKADPWVNQSGKRSELLAALVAVALGYFRVQVGWLGRRRGLFPPPRSCCDCRCHCVRISSYNCICQEGEQDKRALVNPAVTVETVMGPVCLPCSLMPGWAVHHAPATPAHSWIFGLKPQVVVSLCFCPQALQCAEALGAWSLLSENSWEWGMSWTALPLCRCM